jgi:hypothetical protein
LVLGNGWKLFADVLDSRRNPPMSRRGEASIGHVEWDNKRKINRLVSDEDVSWRARSGQDGSDIIASRDTSIPLQPGTIIYFGESRRLLVVVE